MDAELVIRTLKDLSGWLAGSPCDQKKIDDIAARLEGPPLSEEERGKIKHLLSRDMLFHVRWLGDVDVPGFTGDGTAYAWWNYLSKIAEICQKNL